ncbi:hypothetical protein B566_EDAN014353, partial [Ephemera danica]
MMNKTPTKHPAHKEMKLFSLQLLHNNSTITAYGLFNVDSTLLFTITGAATTYLVLLLQFGNESTATASGTKCTPCDVTTTALFTNICRKFVMNRLRLEPKAAILIIGDEILKGQTKDTNSNFACKLFYSLGIKVCKIVVVADDIEEIAKETRLLSQEYTFVLTSGGVGPTHDDITYDGIAAAFEMDLELDSELVSLMKMVYGASEDVTKNPAIKMAWVPKDHELLYIGGKKPKKVPENVDTLYPIVKVKNVYIFPGLPQIFELFLDGLKNVFPSAIGRIYSDTIYLLVDELNVVSALNATVAKFKEHNVTLGSYPVLGNLKYSTRIAIETTDAKVLAEAVDFLKSTIPAKVQVDMTPADPPEELVISFNGGKDCTALLHLTVAALHSWGKSSPTSPRLKALYVRCPEPFSEVEDFVRCAVSRYQLDLIQYDEGIKDAVQHMMQQHPKVKAVLMGNRRSDPHSSNLKPFQMTDPGWPQLMRVFPILEWSYQDVWQVLLNLRIAY